MLEGDFTQRVSARYNRCSACAEEIAVLGKSDQVGKRKILTDCRNQFPKEERILKK
jgi:hypothetical protein